MSNSAPMDRRVQAARDRAAHRRANESQQQRDARLQAERDRSAQRREHETPEERERRLQENRERTAQEREHETPDERERRLQADRERTAQEREHETPDERERRLQADRERTANQLRHEAPVQREARLEADQRRHAQRRRGVAEGAIYRAAVAGVANAPQPVVHNLGLMTARCEHDFCSALHFVSEKGDLLHSCCHNGKVTTPPLSPYPRPLQLLLTGDTAESRNFREFIRQYNSANAFASFGVKTVPVPGLGPYCFKISGAVHHLATSALVQNNAANEPNEPRYGQIFVYDPGAATDYRMHVEENAQCDRQIMAHIDEVLRQVNPYVEHYQRLHQAVQHEEERCRRLGIDVRRYELRLMQDARDDQRRYNAPVTNKECMYLVESGEGDVPKMDLAVHPIGERGCTRISPFSRHTDPMVFPIFFPHGDAGWYIALPITPLQFYTNRIAVRGQFNPLHHGGKLFQQYVVHAYCTVEAQRLMYIRTHQQQLRVECYQGLIDFLAAEAQERALRPGNLIILPSTFVGGPRYMRQKYYDAMTIVRNFGRPDLFITFTCNPKWPEIQSQLQPYQDATARPDIVSRVFQLKVEEFMRLIKKEKIFGTVAAFVYVIEFQKRGLPHIHSLFWLSEMDQLHTGDRVDRVISAEIPNRQEEPELYEIVMRHNIHGPCGVLNPNSVCMQDGRCKKQFPKPFQDATDMSGEGYPKYRRRDNSHENHKIKDMPIHNGWVVPYNWFLSKTFNAHVNVEMCHTVVAVKYLCKYFTKGHDRARVALKEVGGQLMLNEVQEFVDTRCVTPPEATWRLLENDLHKQSHTIYELAVHLPGGQRIFFEEGREEEALRQGSTRDTTLTAWFKLNANDRQARMHLYQDIPKHYVTKKTANVLYWQIRQRGGETVLGRVASVSPRNIELYHLRLLLLNTPGATSFEDLRTINGELHPTFRAAAVAAELVLNDNEWRSCMEEANQYMMPYQLRSLFVVILTNCEIGDPNALWQEFRLAMTEDFRHAGNDDHGATNLALLHIESNLQAAGSSCAEKGIPQPAPDVGLAEDIGIDEDPAAYVAPGEEMRRTLNDEQSTAFEEMLACVERNDTTEPQCFFIDGPGGTGKTYLYRTMYNVLRGMSKKVLCVAYTGIAAILLPHGKTCHTAYRLPLQFNADSACHLTTAEKAVLQQVDVIIWDEAPMASSDMLEVVDRVLRDIMRNENVPFGGKVIVLGGDFRQVLPVIPGATRLQIIRKSLKSSFLFRHFRRLRLSINMRALPEEIEFAQWVLQLGDGALPHPANAKTASSIILPARCLSQNVVEDTFGGEFLPSDTSMHQRVILCPTNEDARLRNEEILDKLRGQKITYKSVDTIGAVEGEDEAVMQQLYPTEFLNSVNLPGLPPHELNIKKGCIVMLMRNLSLREGLCNGTRLIIMDSQPKVLQAKIITGEHKGRVHFIPRITLNTKDDVNVPFNLCRRQFPVKLAYAMTINKGQGQTFEKVGIYLRNPVFAHGQLYVACSRVRTFDSLRIQVFDNEQQGNVGECTMTDNIVFAEVL